MHDHFWTIYGIWYNKDWVEWPIEKAIGPMPMRKNGSYSWLLIKTFTKGPLLSLRQFLTIEILLKMMKNCFCFMSKAFFIIMQIYTFLSWRVGYVEKRLDKKCMVTFKIHDVTDLTTNKYNTHITQDLKKWRQSGNEIWSVNKISREKYFSSKIMQKMRQGD